MWIAGHEGHVGNERADQLAKEGTTSENLAGGFLPQSLIKYTINKHVKEQDAEIWSNKGTRHSKLALANQQPHIKLLQTLQTRRNDYRTAIHLITGHAGLNHHLHKMGLVPTKTCPSCGYEDETVGHFIGHCPAFARIRGESLHTYYASLTEIFENNSILKIVKYANKTRRLLYDPTESIEDGVS